MRLGRAASVRNASRKWIFSGLGSTNKGGAAKTYFFLLLIDYNDFLDDFKQNPLLEKSSKPPFG